jgi:hypothetical protein
LPNSLVCILNTARTNECFLFILQIIDKTGGDVGAQEFLFSSWRGLDKVVALGVMAALPSAALNKSAPSNLPNLLQQLSEEEKLDLLSAIAELCRSLSAIRGCVIIP